jgi:hypothetical protein
MWGKTRHCWLTAWLGNYAKALFQKACAYFIDAIILDATLKTLNPGLAVELERVMKKGKEASGSVVKHGG